MKNSLLAIVACLFSYEAKTLDPEINTAQNELQSKVTAAAIELAALTSIPAAGVTVVRCDIVASSTKGIPKLGSNNPLASEPLFNIGSNAKSMLATVAARLAASGQISFETTIAESGAFPDLTANHPFANVTMQELFSHTSGMATFHTGAMLNTVQTTGTAAQQRRQFAELALNSPPAGPIGQAAYSNAGITVAGVMLEHTANTDVLQLLSDHLFQPLALSAHVGDATDDAKGQPIGHFIGDDGTLTPYLEEEPAIPPFLQSAGYVSISAKDYGKYLQLHLCGLRGEESEFLSAQAIQHLHDPVTDSPYALGWAKTEFAGEEASFHVGGTGTFMAFAVVLPKSGKAIGIMINSPAPEARSAAIEKLRQLAEI